MRPFTIVESVAAPMPDADIDTDILFPARFLTLTQKRGLGRHAFHDKRFMAHDDANEHADDDANEVERPDFVLHRDPWRGAAILVTGPNFGCGSSREQAPWALDDLGIRCLIGPSFGDIFESNCHRNGLLPIRVGPDVHARLMRHASDGGALRVDLERSRIEGCGDPIAFDVPAPVRDALLAGTDEIARILRDDGDRIADFERRQRLAMPWLFTTHT